ncbi:choline-phosphate cytidylyltransferase [Pancytospora philotis]|nr:choline-phosphate cytidylyltransferase [Pancytospora philotis]
MTRKGSERRKSINYKHKVAKKSKGAKAREAARRSSAAREGSAESDYVMLAPSYSAAEGFEQEGMRNEQLYRIPKHRPVRIYCDGVYDLFHYGHARQLEQAKHLFPSVYLLVGVTSDEITVALKGTTVMSGHERYESVRHCKHVDEVVEDAPWIITEDFLAEHQIDLVAHDDIPYSGGGQDDIYAPLKSAHRFVATQRTSGISTSSLITRLLRDYDLFLRRQILRGISHEELNISSFKERQVKISEKLNVEIDGLKSEIKEIVRFWEERSNNWLCSFVKKFESTKIGWIGRLVEFVKKRKLFKN